LDPALTYRNPKDMRGVVDIKEKEPRKRLKELFKHYHSRGDYDITQRFLRKRDWLEVPNRL
jgi:hypothetical protein